MGKFLPSQFIPRTEIDDAYDKLHADLEFAFKRAMVLANMLNISVHESPEVTGTILGLVRGHVERLQNKVAELTDTLATVMAPEWRDIGTLPKIDPDTCRSNDLLGYWPNGAMMVVYLDVCNGWMDSEGGESCITMPTHWRPLPSTPEEESV